MDRGFTIHAAYVIGNDQHVTVMFNDHCDPETFAATQDYLKTLPTSRKLKVVEIVELAKDSDNPVISKFTRPEEKYFLNKREGLWIKLLKMPENV